MRPAGRGPARAVTKRTLAIAMVAMIAACSGGGGPVADARKVLDDGSRFDTSFEAGDALAQIGGRLLDAGRRCDGGCDALLSASAYAQILAVRVLDCTAPGRFEARDAMRSYLDQIDGLSKSAPAPQPPRPPDCF